MIVVHIGLKRCGSASIQNFLSANRRLLGDVGVDYTRVGRQFRPSHANLAAELKNGEGFDSSLGSLSEFVEHCRSSPGTLKVISTEAFEALDASKIARLKRRLDSVGEEIRIIMVIRPLTGLLPSLYAQRIKRGQKSYDFDRFFDFQMVKKRIDYVEIARPWGETFGWENLNVRTLDAGALVNGDLSDDFLAALHVDPGDPRLQALVRPGLSNAADDWRVVEAIRALHKGDIRLIQGHPLTVFLTRADRKFDHGCIERAAIEVGARRGWAGDKGSYLTRPQAQRCLDVCSEALRGLNERLSQRLSTPSTLEATGFSERGFLPDAKQIAPADIKAFYDEMGACFASRAQIERIAQTVWRRGGVLAAPANEVSTQTDQPAAYPVAGEKRLVVHIGLAKSGSASIQSVLAANEKLLRGLSIDYAPVGRRPQKVEKTGTPLRKAHHNLVHQLAHRKKFEAEAGGIGELGDYVASSANHIEIISSEMFANFDARQVAKFRERLGRTDRHIQIIVILRDLISLLPSRYSQKVRYGNYTHDFDEFYNRQIAATRLDHFEMARSWADVFGWENISIRLLDRQCLANGDLIDDFFLTAGVKVDDPRLGAMRRLGALNETSGWKIIEATRALYAGRHGLADDNPLARFAANEPGHFERKNFERAAIEAGGRLGWIGDKGRYLKTEHAQWALDQFTAAIARLNEYLPAPLPAPLDLAARGFVERPFLPSADQIPAAELRSFYDEAAEARQAVIAKRRAIARNDKAPGKGVAASGDARSSADEATP